MVPALAAGQIQGFIVAEPFNALAETRHVGRILRFTGDVWQNHACCVVMMHESDLSMRPAWSQSVTDALVNAQQWIRQHRAETAQLLSHSDEHRYTPHDADVLRQCCCRRQRCRLAGKGRRYPPRCVAPAAD